MAIVPLRGRAIPSGVPIEVDVAGDGTSDDGPEIQAASDSLGVRGGRLIYPAASILIATPVAVPQVNRHWIGAGGIGESDELGDPVAATEFLIADGIDGFTLGDGVANARRGHTWSHLLVRPLEAAPAAGTRGHVIHGMSNCDFHRVAWAGFTGAGTESLRSKGISGANPNQLNEFRACHWIDSLLGPVFEDCAAHYLWGGYLRGNALGVARTAGSVGLQAIGSGGSHKVIGTNVQFWERGIFWDDPVSACHTLDARFEGNDTHLVIEGDRCKERDSTFSNSVIGGTGTAIQVAATATDTVLDPGQITDVATDIDDAGTRTVRRRGTQHRVLKADPLGSQWVNLGAGPTDLDPEVRAICDLTAGREGRMLLLVTIGPGGTGEARLQYSTDNATWSTLTTNTVSLAAAGPKASTWEAIPSGARGPTMVIRCVGINGNGVEDPVVAAVAFEYR